MNDPFEKESGITVGDLVSQLQGCPQNVPISFGPHGHFEFYRVKDRSGCIQIEFNEALGIDYKLLPDHRYMKHQIEHPEQA